MYRDKNKEDMTHAHTHTAQLTPLQSARGFWYAIFGGTCISVADTRDAVQNDINAFLGK